MNVTARKITIIDAALPFFFLILGLIATIGVYYPGLSGPFVFDDIFNIQDNSHLRLQYIDAANLQLAAFSVESGPLRRPLSVLSFALNYYFFGESVFSFKVVNLIIHLVNGMLIFLLSRLLLQLATQKTNLPLAHKINLLSALIASIWLVHPINLTSVLYVVQRMASLSALFVLLSLLTYLYARTLFPRRKPQSITLWTASALFWVCGVASKENALLLPWYIFLVEWLFFYPTYKNPKISIRLYTFVWLVMPLVGGLIYLALHPGMLNFDFRPFTLWERVFTEIRALWYYVGLIVVPNPASLGLFHDDFPISTGALSPWTTVPAVLGFLLVVGAAVYYARRVPLLSFGILFFIAAHAMESSVFPLEIMHEHRNYLASFGILFGGVSSLFLINIRRSYVQPRLLLSVLMIFFIFYSAITLGRAINWQDPARLILSQVDRHPESFGSNYEAGRLYAILQDNTSDWLQKAEFNAEAVRYFSKAAVLAPTDATGLLAILLVNANYPKSMDEPVLQQALGRLREGQPTDVLVNNLLTLSRCERQGDCIIPKKQVDALFEALLENSKLGYSLKRATVLDEMALRAMKSGQYAEAEKLFEQTIALNSLQPMYHLNYAVLLIQLERFDEARAKIRQVLAEPQPKAIQDYAENLVRYIDSGPQQFSQSRLIDDRKRRFGDELLKLKDDADVFNYLQSELFKEDGAGSQ